LTATSRLPKAVTSHRTPGGTSSLHGVRRQSAATTALWLQPIFVQWSQSGVALRLPPQSKIKGGKSRAVIPLTHS